MGDTHSNSSSKFSNNKLCIIQEVSNPSHNKLFSSSKWEAGTSIPRQRSNNIGLIIGPAGDTQIRRAANIHNKML